VVTQKENVDMHRTKKARLAAVVAAGLIGLTLAGSAFAAKSSPGMPRLAGHGKFIQHLVSVEGVKSVAELKQDLKTGMTLWDIAHSAQPTKYASPDALATALLAPVQTKLEAAVSNHRLNSTKETTLYNRLHARVVKLVVTPHPFRQLRATLKRGPAVGRVGGIRSGLVQAMVATCGIKAADLRTAVKTGGKSLLAICQSGTKAPVTQKALVSALTSAIQTRLEARAKAMGVTLNQAMEQQILGRIEAGLNILVTTPIPSGGLHF
jgi:hypothetical protein